MTTAMHIQEVAEGETGGGGGGEQNIGLIERGTGLD
jgi:hypothetical protein